MRAKIIFMVKISFACLLVLGGALALPAKDLASYRVGDTAELDVTTPVPLDVVDPVSTALLKESEKLNTPAIFRDFTASATNATAREFLAAFAATHASFTTALLNAFHESTLDEAAISSPEFGNLLATFQGKYFPVPAELETLWARGDAGLDTRDQWLAELLQTMHQPVRDGDLPEDFVVNDLLRLVPVNSPDEAPALDAAEQSGTLVAKSTLTTLARIQVLFRNGFSENAQPLARALAAFLKPTCAPDVTLTQQARDRAVRPFAVVDHYEPGQIVVHRGAPIDVKTKVALDLLNEKLMPVELKFQMEVERERTQQQTQHDRDATASLQSQALEARARSEWLLAALGALAVVTLIAFWQAGAQHRRAVSLALARAADSQSPLAQSNIAVHLAQAVKEALLQELANQRVELLKAQQDAANELARLVHRLDELQTPLQQRLQAYETQLKKLGTEGGNYLVPDQAAAPDAPADSVAPEHQNGNGAPPANNGDKHVDVASLLVEGQLLLDENEPEKAVKCFDAILAVQPDHAETLIKKGGALERLGQLDEAVACYDRAIAADGTMTIAYLHKGGLFNRMARYDEAMACYEKALRTQVKNPA
jgi:tetratricopeptide (TPR) repeat protein